jgi:hypothetical protein
MIYVLLTIISVGMIIFSVGAAFIATEEQSYRYDINLTDEHEI